MTKLRCSIVLASLLICSLPHVLVAEEKSDYLTSLINESATLKLHESKRWLSLLHYRRSSITDGYKSEIDDARFFLSGKGSENPRLELNATLAAFFVLSPVGDNHPQCLFPARFKWLKNALLMKIKLLPLRKCNSLAAWKKQFNSSQVTLVFAESYLSHPASIFGHTLLRFDENERSDYKINLTSYTVSYVANESAIKGSIEYILGGVFTGLPGVIAVVPYYQKLKEYGDIENRDIWEYRLDLEISEIESLIYHLWELKDKQIDYYFIDENCAYRLITILEAVVDDLDIAKGFSFRTMPVEMVKELNKAGLIKGYQYRPSAVKTFYYHVGQLGWESRDLVMNLTSGPFDFTSLNSDLIPDRNKILISAMEYLSILANKNSVDQDDMKRRYHQILMNVDMKGGPSSNFDEPAEPGSSPLQTHSGNRFSITKGGDAGDGYVGAEYRYAYHDLTDPAPGFPIGAHLELFKFGVRDYEGTQAKVYKLSLIEMESLTPMNRYFMPATWRFSVVRERYHDDIDNGMHSFLDFGLGLTAEVKKALLYTILQSALEYGGEVDGGYSVGLGVKFGVLYNLSGDSGNISGQYTDYVVGGKHIDKFVRWKHNRTISNSLSLFLEVATKEYDINRSSEVGVGMSLYF